MLRILIGIAIIAGSVAFFIFMFQDPANNEQLATFLTDMHCNEGETIVQDSFFTDNTNSTRSLRWYCENLERQRRDVSDGVIGFMIISFVVPLLVGIFVIIWGASGVKRRQTQRMVNAWQSGSGTVNMSNIPPDVLATVERITGQLFNSNINQTDQPTLSERLKQLEDARKKRLIDDLEYQRVRQAILDSMDDV